MKKTQENKKIWIIAGIIVAIVVIISLVVMCGQGDEDKKKNSDISGQGTVVDEESESVNEDDGVSSELEIAEPEEADKLETENKVEFVGPGGMTDSNSNENSSNNSSSNEITDNEEKDNGDNTDDTGNLDEEPDSNGQYGGFF